jgi:hypothetical protein
MTNDDNLNASVSSRFSDIKQEISQLRSNLQSQKSSDSHQATVNALNPTMSALNPTTYVLNPTTDELNSTIMQQLDHCLTTAATLITVSMTSANQFQPSMTQEARTKSKTRRKRYPLPVTSETEGLFTHPERIDDASSSSTVPISAQSNDSRPHPVYSTDANDDGETLVVARHDYLSQLEPELIQHWHDNGQRYFKKGKYAEAIKYLEEALSRSEKLFGEKFESKNDVSKTLASCYWALKKWDSLHQILNSMLPGKSENSLDGIASCHEFAEVYLARMHQGDLKLAEDLCKETFQRRKHILKTQKHGLIYESLDLLVRILQAKGEDLEAEAYRSLIPPGALGPLYSDLLS